MVVTFSAATGNIQECDFEMIAFLLSYVMLVAGIHYGVPECVKNTFKM